MSNPLIKISVSQADATLVQTCTITAGMQSTPTVRFTFSDEWDNLGKMAVVRAGSSAVEVLVVNNQITIPSESVAVAGVNLIVGVYGANTSIVIPTVWCSVGEILDGTTIEDADNNETPTPSDVQLMLEYAAAVEAAAETLEENVITETQVVDTNANQYGTVNVDADLVDASETGKKLKLTFENLKGNGITDITYSNSGEYKGRINIATDANPSGTNYDALIEPIAHFEEVTDEAEESALKAEGYALGTQDGEPSEIYAENNAFYFASLASEYAEDANDAQSAAEDAQEAAETAQGKAEDAQEAAEAAATSASDSAGSAAGSALSASSSASSASEFAIRAEVAASTATSIAGLTVSAETLQPNESATATVTGGGDDPFNIEFGIPKGVKGDTGAVPAFTIGTVQRGTDADATITGTASNPVLNLTLPKGDKGDTGNTGNNGADGDDGITPAVSVTSISGGHNVAFSYGTGDARNTDFDVMDGTPYVPSGSEVADAIDDWMDENIMQETGYVLDRSLTASNAAAPADLVGEQSEKIDDLKSALYANYSIYKPEPLPESLYVYEDKVLNGNGTALTTVVGYYTTDFIPIYSDALCITGGFIPENPNFNTLVLYDENFNPIYKAYEGTEPLCVCRHYNAKYFRASHDSNDTYYANVWENNDIKKYYTSPEPLVLASEYYVNKKCVMNDQGIPVSGYNTWATTDFIRLDNRDVVFTGNFIPTDQEHPYITFALYDKDREMIMHARDNDIVHLSDYPEAVYFRASHATDTDLYYLSITNKANNDSTAGLTVHVGVGQTYTTLRAGIAAAIMVANSTVVVHPGVYDLTSEFATEIQTGSGAVDVGITLANNVHVIFLSGAYVKAIFNTSNAWISEHFSPFMGRDFVLEGLNIEASNCRYCVHDEQMGADVQYHNVYQNCVMKMTTDASSGASFLSPQCLGGGLGKYGYIEIIGGHYSSYCTDASVENPPITFHNGYTAGCDGKIFIRDVYLANDGFFRFGYYGASTIITRVMVSGCSMGAPIMKRPENQTAHIDNFEIVEWNNIIRS